VPKVPKVLKVGGKKLGRLYTPATLSNYEGKYINIYL